jgi:pimeloyl-ACP methyl ester carboxylesterase
LTSGAGHPILGELQERVFDAESVTINYIQSPASGPPLVLLHGVGRNWQDFLPLIPKFSGRCQVFALDMRGHGKSGRVPQGYFSRDYASDVAAFLRSVVKRRSILFGHSLGGVVAMRIAAEQPALVRAAILGDVALSGDYLADSMYQALFEGLHRVLVEGGSVDEIARRLGKVQIRVPGIDHPVAIGDLPGNNETYLIKWADCLKKVDPEVMLMAKDGRNLADYDGRTLLPRMQCPTLILQANPELGGLLPESDIEMALKLLPQGQVVRFPLLGHALHLQRPQPVIDAVMNFLVAIDAA